MFQFKQFTVKQDQAAFKVGTDACLLGAWAPVTQINTILDIGTGTGVIALMLAQRNTNAKIHAIEPDLPSFHDARKNLQDSPWHDRITCENTDLENFAQRASGTFDLIACNPPFFINSTPNPDVRKTAARHEVNLPLEALIQSAARLLSPEGRIALVLPADRRKDLQKECEKNHLFEQRVLLVAPNDSKPINRMLCILSRQSLKTHQEVMVLYRAPNTYSSEASELLAPFYLYL